MWPNCITELGVIPESDEEVKGGIHSHSIHVEPKEAIFLKIL